tara:strand:- start:332 stop:559 length:228 start_codon:yes stop_codon:yes gene_type:complete
LKISERLDEDPEPFKPVSKDHTRANHIGINLEQLKNLQTIKENVGSESRNPFRYERRSMDVSKANKKIFGAKKFS